MKIYNNVDVNMTYQNCGSTWYGILHGSAENIDLVFNGLYNLMGTNDFFADGKKGYEFFDTAQTIAVFWTNEKKMRRFFFNQKMAHELLPSKEKIAECNQFADAQIEALKLTHETLLRSKDNTLTDVSSEYNMGSVQAERPDNDFKDSVLSHAFSAKE